MYRLTDLLRDHLIDQGAMRVSLATSGSTTSLTDSNRNPTESERQWRDGTIIILRDAAGAGADPEGQFGRISSFSSGTFGIEPNLTAAVDTGDRYGVAPRTVEHQMLIELANQALVQLGHIGFIDESIVTAGEKREYQLIPSAKRRPIRVRIQRAVGNPDANLWQEVTGWRTDWSEPGVGGKLIFENQPEPGRLLSVEYYDVHPTVNAWDDIIHEVIHPALARASMTERVANYLSQQAQQTDQPRRDAWNRAKAEYEAAKDLYPIRKPSQRPPIFLGGKSGNYYPGDRGAL